MMHQIDVQNDLDYPVDVVRLRHVAEQALTLQSALPESSLTIVITNDAAITDLNRTYRGVDAPTDVLSFPADVPPVSIPDEPPYLGDLVIAYPYMLAQAEREGITVEDSVALLVVHGILHLLGYNHDTPDSRTVMWAAQEAVLRALEISTDIVPLLEDEHTNGEA